MPPERVTQAGRTRVVLLATCTVAIVASGGPVAAEVAAPGALELRYARTVTEVLEPNATRQGGEAPEPRSGPVETSADVVVRLEPDRLAIREGAAETIYDFGAKTIHRLDHETETYRRYSLFVDVGFRNAELANRLKLREAFESAGVADHPLDPMEIETLFSMGTGVTGDPVTVAETDDGGLAFSVGTREIARVEPDGRQVPDELRRALGRFLVYGHNLHPDVRRRIADDGRLPRVLEYRFSNIASRSEVHARLQSVAETSSPIAVPAGFGPAAAETRLEALLAGLDDGSSGAAPSLEDYVAEAALFREDGRTFDALLALVESTLATVDQPLEEMRELVAGSGDDERVRTLLTMIGTGGEDPRAALELNRSLERAGLEKGYVLDIFLANYSTVIGESDAAIELFVGVLESNPWITGVYKDLGDIHYGRYDMETAWRCWDAARTVRPGHPMLAPVDALEDRLESRYPDFF